MILNIFQNFSTILKLFGKFFLSIYQEVEKSLQDPEN